MYNFDKFQAAKILQVQIFRAEQSKKMNRKRKKGTKLFCLFKYLFYNQTGKLAVYNNYCI